MKNKVSKEKTSGWAVEENGKIGVASPINELFEKDGDEYTLHTCVTLTKEEAKICFDNGISQRDLGKKSVEFLLNIINDGKWTHKIGDPIGFTKDRRLSNGQHRIEAFLLSNKDVLNFSVATNVLLEDTINFVDIGKPKNPKDRISMLIKNMEDPRPNGLETYESTWMSANICGTPIASKMGYGNKADFQILKKLYLDPVVSKSIVAVGEYYDKLHININKRRKKNPVLWGIAIRALPYMAYEDFDAFMLLSLNPLTNTTESYHGWGKRSFSAIDDYINGRGKGKKGASTVRNKLYAVLNTYLFNFINRIPCSTTTSKSHTTKKNENFLFPHEKEFLEPSVHQEKENYIDTEIKSNVEVDL